MHQAYLPSVPTFGLSIVASSLLDLEHKPLYQVGIEFRLAFAARFSDTRPVCPAKTIERYIFFLNTSYSYISAVVYCV